MEMTLNILAKDIMESNYMNYLECPITKALNRAGFIGYSDGGVCIDNEYNEPIITLDNPQYNKLVRTVTGMYGTKMNHPYHLYDEEIPFVPIEDFTITINY